MQERRATLDMYQKILNDMSVSSMGRVREELDISEMSFGLKLLKLRLTDTAMTANEESIVKKYYSSLGPAIIYLLPNRTVKEVMECVERLNVS